MKSITKREMLFEIDLDKKSSYSHFHRWENFKNLWCNFGEMVWYVRVVGGWVIFFFLTHTVVLSGLFLTQLSEYGLIHQKEAVWLTERVWILCQRPKLESQLLHIPALWSGRNNWQFFTFLPIKWFSVVAQWSRICLLMQETWVWSLGWVDPLEKKMATHSNILVWKIPQTGDPGGLQCIGSQKRQTWRLNTTPSIKWGP